MTPSNFNEHKEEWQKEMIEARIERMCKQSKPTPPGRINLLMIEKELNAEQRCKSAMQEIHPQRILKIFGEWFVMLEPFMQREVIEHLKLNQHIEKR